MPQNLIKSFAKLIEFYKTDMPNDDEDVMKFMKYNANTCLNNLGYENKYEVYEIDINPIVLNGLSTETKSHDVFSTKGNGYQKGKYEELQDEDFII